MEGKNGRKTVASHHWESGAKVHPKCFMLATTSLGKGPPYGKETHPASSNVPTEIGELWGKKSTWRRGKREEEEDESREDPDGFKSWSLLWQRDPACSSPPWKFGFECTGRMCTSAISVEESQQPVPFAICQGSDPEHHCSTSMWMGPCCPFLGSASAAWGLQFFAEQHQGRAGWSASVEIHLSSRTPSTPLLGSPGRCQAQLRPGDHLCSESMPCSMAHCESNIAGMPSFIKMLQILFSELAFWAGCSLCPTWCHTVLNAPAKPWKDALCLLSLLLLLLQLQK